MIVRNEDHSPIKPNHSKALPRYIVAICCVSWRNDCDSSQCRFDYTFRLAVVITARLIGTKPTNIMMHRFTSRSELWNHIVKFTSLRHTTWIVAHNALRNFILSGLTVKFETGEAALDWPRASRTEIKDNVTQIKRQPFCVIETPPTIISFRVAATQGRCLLVDSLNWFDDRPSKLAVSCGINTLHEPTLHATTGEWFQFAEQECKVVFKTFALLLDWVRTNDFGMFRYTAAGQSMAAYRHKFMRHKIYCHNNKDIRKIERAGYFGGRTEIFKIGRTIGPIHQLDVNSLFPSIMAVGKFPCVLDRYELRNSYSVDWPNFSNGNYIAEVQIDTEKSDYPLRLPTRVAYPVGRFATTLCGEELSSAFTECRIRSVKSWAEYGSKVLFAEFVNRLWQMRQAYKLSGNLLYERFVKQLLNSLYGKFAQLSPKWVNCPNDLAALPWTRWSLRNYATRSQAEFRSFGFDVQKQTIKTELPNTFVAISAFITSAARSRMNQLRFAAGINNVYYQAVDSLLVNDAGLSRLDNAGEIMTGMLGKLRHEITADDLCIYGNNDYRLGEKIVRAGIHFDGCPDETDNATAQRWIAAELLFNGAAAEHIREEFTPFIRQSTSDYRTNGPDGWLEPFDATPLFSADSGSAIGSGSPPPAAINK